MKRRYYIIIVSLIFLTSCADKHVFQGVNLDNFEKLDLDAVIQIENKKKSKDITPKHLIEIGEGIYPNTNKYILATPKTYVSDDTPEFRLETEYFYSVNDSNVRVILYQWDDSSKNISDFLGLSSPEKNLKFQEKFESLKDELTEKLGNPTSKNIELYKIIDGHSETTLNG